jgi:Cys-rich protein (TIGR01571 family)
MRDGYATTLCDCCDDCGICLYVLCCSWTLIPTAQAWAGSILDWCNVCHWCGFVCPMWTRVNIRRHWKVPVNDYCLYCTTYVCCFPCATCQDLREIPRLRAAPFGRPTDGPVRVAQPGSAAPYSYEVPPGYPQPAVYAQQPPADVAPWLGAYPEPPAAIPPPEYGQPPAAIPPPGYDQPQGKPYPVAGSPLPDRYGQPPPLELPPGASEQPPASPRRASGQPQNDASHEPPE